jgi:hypothetical protein
VTNDERRAPGGPGEQFRDRLLSGVQDRTDDQQHIVGAVVVVAVILLLIPRGATGPDLWLILALVCGGAIIETLRIRRAARPSGVGSGGRPAAGRAVPVRRRRHRDGRPGAAAPRSPAGRDDRCIGRGSGGGLRRADRPP